MKRLILRSLVICSLAIFVGSCAIGVYSYFRYTTADVMVGHTRALLASSRGRLLMHLYRYRPDAQLSVSSLFRIDSDQPASQMPPGGFPEPRQTVLGIGYGDRNTDPPTPPAQIEKLIAALSAALENRSASEPDRARIKERLDAIRNSPRPVGMFQIPYWLIALISGIAPLRWLMVHRRSRLTRRRRELGQCVNCGYDLRATPERCPECGAESKSL